MKKIAIITITHGTNYGNRLQNYATQVTLEKLGVKAETIDHSYISVDGNKRSLFKRIMTKIDAIKNNSFNSNIMKLINYNYNKNIESIRTDIFKVFNGQYITYSKIKTSNDIVPNNINDEYDYFICGSDQIWNPYHPEGAKVYFLTFSDYEKNISYAPSLGINNFPDNMKELYTTWINNIKFLSVREEAGANIIKKLTGRDAEVLLDPTLMLSKNEWLKISKKPITGIRKPYILTYFLGNKSILQEKRIKEIAEKYKLEIINLLDKSHSELYTLGPSEFIWLINNCTLFCTDSFHGCVFSIIMKKPFIVFERKDRMVSMNSRLDTLLSRFNMETRKESNLSSDEQLFNIDFMNIDKIIEEEKEKSFNYLRNALNLKN